MLTNLTIEVTHVLAYGSKRLIQRHAPPTDDVVLIYDLARSADENRLEPVEGFGRAQDVGWPVRVEDGVKGSRYFIETPKGRESRACLTDFVWLANDWFAFIEYDGRATSTLVFVELPEGPAAPPMSGPR